MLLNTFKFMTIDSEASALVQRLEDIEDRLISDEVLEESVYQSIKTLERIFGRDSIFKELLDRLKSSHKVKKLKSAVKSAITESKTSIEVANASAIFPHLKINKNSVLADYLADNGRLSTSKLRRFHEYFAKIGVTLEKAFEKGNPEEVKKLLKEYIEILETEENYLRENIQRMTGDIRYAWSVHNLMAHEVAHWVWGELSKTRNIYAMALNEAYSFALQKLMHTFENSYVFDKETLLNEARELYRFIIPRKHAYSELTYKFMKSFIILIGTLVLCDSIARKDRDYRNKKLFLQSYSSPTLISVSKLIEQAINNLKNPEFQSIIRETLLKTGISQLQNCKGNVINDIGEHLKKLPEFVQKTILVIGGGINRREDWKSFRESLTGSGVLNNNTRQFVASLDLLRMMGYENEAREYRERYLTILKETLDKVTIYVKDKESEIYKREEHVIDGVIAVVKEEEQDLVEILQQLKSW